MKYIDENIIKYPRTPHLEGSNLQIGDSSKDRIPIKSVAGRRVVIEEKMDGANSGVSFSKDGDILLQSRGHFLVGGGREKHFELFKAWANRHIDDLFDILGTRHVMYGEWMFAKHTVFYNALPDRFLEFDIWDKEHGKFLSTPERRKMLDGSPVISVPVLHEGGMPKNLDDLLKLVGNSSAKTESWKTDLKEVCKRHGLDFERALGETDQSDLMEGLYVKFETDTETIGRAKWVRHGFLQTILDNDTHWLSRPIIPNIVKSELNPKAKPSRTFG